MTMMMMIMTTMMMFCRYDLSKTQLQYPVLGLNEVGAAILAALASSVVFLVVLGPPIGYFLGRMMSAFIGSLAGVLGPIALGIIVGKEGGGRRSVGCVFLCFSLPKGKRSSGRSRIRITLVLRA
jgi:hypothetical protein